jgi:hypothetical protein
MPVSGPLSKYRNPKTLMQYNFMKKELLKSGEVLTG